MWSESESHSVMSNSLWPHGLHSPWNSPGQNAGVGILSLLQAIFPTQGSNSGLQHCRPILYQLSHKGSKNTGVGSLSLLQGIFPTQGSNPGLWHYRQILYQLSYQGSPTIMTFQHIIMALQQIFSVKIISFSPCRVMIFQNRDIYKIID